MTGRKQVHVESVEFRAGEVRVVLSSGDELAGLRRIDVGGCTPDALGGMDLSLVAIIGGTRNNNAPRGGSSES